MEGAVRLRVMAAARRPDAILRFLISYVLLSIFPISLLKPLLDVPPPKRFIFLFRIASLFKHFFKYISMLLFTENLKYFLFTSTNFLKTSSSFLVLPVICNFDTQICSDSSRFSFILFDMLFISVPKQILALSSPYHFTIDLLNIFLSACSSSFFNPLPIAAISHFVLGKYSSVFYISSSSTRFLSFDSLPQSDITLGE